MNTKHRRKKTHRVTKKMYISKLKTHYPSCKYDGSLKNPSLTKYAEHKITYGEMDYEGLDKLYKKVILHNSKIDTFIDVGSGRGKLCLFMAAIEKIKKSIGIELVKERVDDALELKEKLAFNYSNKVSFINSNIFDVDFKSIVNNNSQVFVWFSNLCFEQSTTDNIFKKLVDELPSNTIICCSKKILNNNPKLIFIETLPVEMSWDKGSNVYIYKTD
jgi:tRNA G46 methylase TrmB